MERALESNQSAGPAPCSGEGERHLRPGALLVLGVFVASLTWLFAAGRRTFHVYFDEPGQFAMARWIAGGQRWSLFDLDTWQPGYALLIAPLYVVTDEVTAVFRVAMVVNALLAGAAAVLLAMVARRITDLSAAACCILAMFVSLRPSSLSAAAIAWGEPLVTLLFLGAVLATMRHFDGNAPMSGIVAVVLAVAASLTHGRMMPLVLVVGLAVVGRDIASSRSRAAWSACALVGSFAASLWFAAVVRANVWDEPGSENTARSTLARLSDPASVAVSLVGQVWYQLAASVLVVGAGVAVVVMRSVERPTVGTLRRRRDARLLIASTVPLVAISVVFMARSGRSDFAIYGRYNDAVLGPVLVVGGAWLWRAHESSHRHVVRVVAGCLAVFVAATVVVQLRSGDDLSEDLGLGEMVAGVLPLTVRGESLSPYVAAGVAVAIGALLLVSRLFALPHGDRVLAATAVVLAVSAGGLTAAGLRPTNAFATASQVRAIRDLVPPGTVIGVHIVGPDEPSYVSTNAQRRAALLYQGYLPDYRFVTDRGLDDDVGPFVFAPRQDPTLSSAGGTELWVAQDSGMALWREPVGE